MTQPVVEQRNTVLALSFTNPLKLEANAEVASHVKVYADDELLVLGVDYTLDGVGDVGDLDEIEGVDAYLDEAIITSNLYDTYTIVHAPPMDQDTDLSGGGQFGLAFEGGLDAVVRRLQALASIVGRMLQLPVDATGIDVTLPHPIPSRALKWNEAGTALVNSGLDPDLGDVDIAQVVALSQPQLEANLLSTIAEAVDDSEAAQLAAESARDIAIGQAGDAATARGGAEAAQLAAEEARDIATAAAGANSPMEVQIVAAAAKATPADADLVGFVDTADSNKLKKLTWANAKAFLKTYFDGLYAGVAHTHTFASLTAKPTTLAGYGITDAADKIPTFNAVGSYIFAKRVSGSASVGEGSTVAGSQLRPTNAWGHTTGTSLAGTWVCLGRIAGAINDDDTSTLWGRIV